MTWEKLCATSRLDLLQQTRELQRTQALDLHRPGSHAGLYCLPAQWHRAGEGTRLSNQASLIWRRQWQHLSPRAAVRIKCCMYIIHPTVGRAPDTWWTTAVAPLHFSKVFTPHSPALLHGRLIYDCGSQICGSVDLWITDTVDHSTSTVLSAHLP